MPLNVIFFAVCGLSLAASIPDLLVNPASKVVYEYGTFYYAPLGGVDDLAFTADYGKTEARILKRDSNGNYVGFTGIPLRNTSVATITNGEWFASLFSEGIELFRVDQNGQYYNYSIIETGTTRFVAKLLEDNSLMIAFEEYIVTCEYDNTEWVVINNSTFIGEEFLIFAASSASVQRNALVVFSNKLNADNTTYNIYIITRQSDKSWKIIDTIAVNETFLAEAYTFFWDGSNTLVSAPLITGASSYGAVVVFNKINGVWKISQCFSAASVGVTQFGYFGLGPLVALDNNNVLVVAPADGVADFSGFLPGAGSVFLMQRNDKNEWNFVARFKSNSTVLGIGMAKNNQDILMLGCTYNGTFFCSIHTLPTCLVSPIDVTCPQQRDSCDVDLDNLVVVNNPQCGQITSSYNRIVTDKNIITMDVTLSRLLVADVKCSLTLTCSELSTVSSGQILVTSMALFSAIVAFALM